VKNLTKMRDRGDGQLPVWVFRSAFGGRARRAVVCGSRLQGKVLRGTRAGSLASWSAASPAGHRGAYAGVGDLGDSGGANLADSRSRVFTAHTRTDAQGRSAFRHCPDQSPLVVTHPEFVRHDEMVALGRLP